MPNLVRLSDSETSRAVSCRDSCQNQPLKILIKPLWSAPTHTQRFCMNGRPRTSHYGVVQDSSCSESTTHRGPWRDYRLVLTACNVAATTARRQAIRCKCCCLQLGVYSKSRDSGSEHGRYRTLQSRCLTALVTRHQSHVSNFMNICA